MWITDKKRDKTGTAKRNQRKRDPRKRAVINGKGSTNDLCRSASNKNDLESLVKEKKMQFQNVKDEIPALKQEIDRLRQKAIACTQRWQIREKKDTQEEIKRLETLIEKATNGEEEKKYEEKVEKFLQVYKWNQRQELLSRKRKRNDDQANFSQPAIIKSSTVLNGVFPETNDDVEQRPAKRQRLQDFVVSSHRPNNTTTPSTTFSATAQDNKVISSKAQNINIIKEYLTEFENEPPSIHITQQDICEHCDKPMLQSINGSLLICPYCQHGYPYIDATSASMSYGDEVEFSSFTYKRIGHFEDWLKKFQAKGSKRVEDTIIQSVMGWLYTHKYDNVDLINKDLIRKALKELVLKKYYDHDMQIYCRITAKKPPSMTPEQEEVCRLMFMAIQTPFLKWVKKVDPTRKNFLSYSYCLYQFCRLRGYEEFLPFFNLLKGRKNRKTQDEIFKGICKDLDWEFIPTV